jgi:hypothetical protein
MPRARAEQRLGDRAHHLVAAGPEGLCVHRGSGRGESGHIPRIDDLQMTHTGVERRDGGIADRVHVHGETGRVQRGDDTMHELIAQADLSG